MTIKEKKLELIKALGLEIGDIITVGVYNVSKYIICEEQDDIFLKLDGGSYCLNIYHLILDDWVKLEKPIKNGDLKCDEIRCRKCPLFYLNCGKDNYKGYTLYQVIENLFLNNHNEDYQYFKSKLNKVVENENEILN